MARFYGEIGYGESVETAPGVYRDVVVEHKYYGDVLRNTRKSDPGESVNNDVTVMNTISIIADAFAWDNIFNMKYIVWMGVRWAINNVEVQRPRLVLSMGGVYNGETPETSGTP